MATTTAVSPAISTVRVSSRSTRATIVGSVPSVRAIGISPVRARATAPALVRPVGEQAQGDGDDGGLGGHGHAPADPLHAPAVDGAGLDVADVAGVEAEPERQRPQHGDRPDHQAVAVGHQRRRPTAIAAT